MTDLVLLLGGKGERLSKIEKKQYIKLDNLEIFVYPLKTCLEIKKIRNIVLVVPQNDEVRVKNILKRKNIEDSRISLVEGGRTRQESVLNALLYLRSKKCKEVIIHDGVRPFVSKKTILEHIEALKESPINATFIPLDDSFYYQGKIDHSSSFKRLQTPFSFNFNMLLEAYLELDESQDIHDDLSIFLNKYPLYKINFIKGSEENIKLTRKEDLKQLKYILDVRKRNK